MSDQRKKPIKVSAKTNGTTNTKSPLPNKVNKETDTKLDNEIVYEFGGPLGVAAMMIGFPLLMYYFWFSLHYYSGSLMHPTSLQDVVPFLHRMVDHFWDSAAPDFNAFVMYGGFCLYSAILAAFLPGPIVKGLPIPSEGYRQLDYVCNGVNAWYIMLLTSIVVHVTGVFPLTSLIDNFGRVMSVAIIFGLVITLITYFLTIAFGKPHRMSGNIIYDIFMGASLNPRIGRLDLKMWAEIRVPWVILFFISVSCALKQLELYGTISTPALFMVLAHFLYVNACAKGEECIPTTWDIFYEKWGFMLIFWNLAGVPFTYCLSSLYILKVLPMEAQQGYPLWYAFCVVLLISGYYIWDTCNSQKNRFRMTIKGTYIPRKTFPQLPWGTLENPSYIKTEHGNLLLTDGWYRYARKIHYTADLMMSLSWGFITGFGSFLPYFYVTFFIAVLTHRVSRDMERCAKKYGKDWEKYCQTVPYIFIPYVY